MEQAGARRRYHQGGGAGRAGRLAAHRDVARVAAERGDIALHPAERLLLVHQSVVAEVMALGIERRMAEIAEQAEAVVDRDDDGRAGRAALDERAGVIVVALAVEQSAAMDPEQDWKLLAVVGVPVGVRREDVQVETVLGHADRAGEHTELGDLRAGVGRTSWRSASASMRRQAAAAASADRRLEAPHRECRGTCSRRCARTPEPVLRRFERWGRCVRPPSPVAGLPPATEPSNVAAVQSTLRPRMAIVSLPPTLLEGCCAPIAGCGKTAVCHLTQCIRGCGIGRIECLHRQFRQRDIDRCAEHCRRAEEGERAGVGHQPERHDKGGGVHVMRRLVGRRDNRAVRAAGGSTPDRRSPGSDARGGRADARATRRDWRCVAPSPTDAAQDAAR